MTDEQTSESDFDLLLAEFTSRIRHGESPDIERYVSEHPALAEKINELFPLVLHLEDTKQAPDSKESRKRWTHSTLEVIGDYSLIREIGRGGMGVVYEARQSSLDRRVAIKILQDDLAANKRSLARFQREARLAARLHHHNIVPVLGTGNEDGVHFIVMQIIDGIGLDQVLHMLVSEDEHVERESQTDLVQTLAEKAILDPLSHEIDWTRFAMMASGLASAIAHAHECGVIHRDIKPSNILLDRKGNAWIADFGLARSIATDDATRIAGTPRYMAPEQIHGDSTSASDIYALGLTLYELASQHRVFGDVADDEANVASKKINLPAVSEIDPRVPLELNQIIMKCVAVESDDRYPTANDLHEDFERFLSHRPLASSGFSPIKRLKKWIRRNPQTALASAIAFALLIGIASISSMNYWRELNLRTKTQNSLDVSVSTLEKVYQRLSPDNDSQRSLSNADAELLNDLLQSYDELSSLDGNNVKLKKTAAKANFRVGMIQARLGYPVKAADAFDKSIRIYRELVQQGEDDTGIFKLQIARGAIEKAKSLQPTPSSPELHSSALEYVETTLEQGKMSEETRKNLVFEKARVLFLLGRPQKRRPEDFKRHASRKVYGIKTEAMEFMDRAVGILENWTSPQPENVSSLLARAYAERASSFDDPDLIKSISIQEKLVDDNPESRHLRADLVDVCSTFDPIELAVDQYPDAIRLVRRAIKVGSSLDQNDRRHRRLLQHAYHKASIIYEQIDETSKQFTEQELSAMLGNNARIPIDMAIDSSRKALEVLNNGQLQNEIDGSDFTWRLRFQINLCRLLWKRNQSADREEVRSIIESTRNNVGSINLSSNEGQALSELLKQLGSVTDSIDE